MRQHLRADSGRLDDRPLGSEVAHEDGKAARLRVGVLDRPNHVERIEAIVIIVASSGNSSVPRDHRPLGARVIVGFAFRVEQLESGDLGAHFGIHTRDRPGLARPHATGPDSCQ